MSWVPGARGPASISARWEGRRNRAPRGSRSSRTTSKRTTSACAPRACGSCTAEEDGVGRVALRIRRPGRERVRSEAAPGPVHLGIVTGSRPRGRGTILDHDEAHAVEENVSLALRAVDPVPVVRRLGCREGDPCGLAVRAEEAHPQLSIPESIQRYLLDNASHGEPLAFSGRRCDVSLY